MGSLAARAGAVLRGPHSSHQLDRGAAGNGRRSGRQLDPHRLQAGLSNSSTTGRRRPADPPAIRLVATSSTSCSKPRPARSPDARPPAPNGHQLGQRTSPRPARLPPVRPGAARHGRHQLGDQASTSCRQYRLTDRSATRRRWHAARPSPARCGRGRGHQLDQPHRAAADTMEDNWATAKPAPSAARPPTRPPGAGGPSISCSRPGPTPLPPGRPPQAPASSRWPSAQCA